jgi:nucleoside-diphosphate-sugar epimerase
LPPAGWLAVPETFGILGATSFVAAAMIEELRARRQHFLAYSRQPGEGAAWRRLGEASPEPIDCWLGVAPIWTLPAHFSLIEASGARRLVQLSSVGRYSKAESTDLSEAALAARIEAAEATVAAWAEGRGIVWTILRPTLIYGAGDDRNISEIARLIDRFGFFPLCGPAKGLRQPLAVRDVASAMLAAAAAPAAGNRAYDLGGGETLSYRAMVERVFEAERRRPILLPLPLAAFRLGEAVIGPWLPGGQRWTLAMAARMNVDITVDNGPAGRDFGYAPRWFEPEPLPRRS